MISNIRKYLYTSILLLSDDGGENWERVPSENLPKPLENEAGFAASGTGIGFINDSVIYFGLGCDEARFYQYNFKSHQIKISTTPLAHGKLSYSIAFSNTLHGVQVGGNWEDVYGDSTMCYSADGGETWKLSQGASAYCSCVCAVNDSVFLATGLSGTYLSKNYGKSWKKISNYSFNAIAAFKDSNMGIAVGSKGNVAHFNLILTAP